MSILEIFGSNKFWNINNSGMAHHNVKGVARSSHGVSGVMANSGFGSMSLIINGKKVMLPAAALKKNGCIKKSWANAVSSRDIATLVAKGATIAVA